MPTPTPKSPALIRYLAAISAALFVAGCDAPPPNALPPNALPPNALPRYHGRYRPASLKS